MTNIIRRRSPLADLQSELNQMFSSDWFSGNDLPSTVSGDWTPAIDIKETENGYLIRADVPGVDPNEIEVHFENGMLTLKGEKEMSKKDTKDDYMRVERSYGSFVRRFSMPDAVDSDNISAKCTHGVLEITVPRSNNARAKKISVSS